MTDEEGWFSDSERNNSCVTEEIWKDPELNYLETDPKAINILKVDTKYTDKKVYVFCRITNKIIIREKYDAYLDFLAERGD